MSKTLITPILFLISYLCFAQDKVVYDDNAQKRMVDSFQAISVSSGIDVIITQGTEEGVVVSASDIDFRDKIKTEVENGTLKIYVEQGWMMGWNWRNRKLKAYVAVKSLTKISASAGSDVIIQGILKVAQLAMHFSSGSDFKGQVSVTDLTVDQSSGSDIHIRGNAVNVRIRTNSGSNFKGFDLMADYGIIETSSGSDAELTVTKEIAAEASSGSDVHYKGNPVIKYKSSHSGGSISKKG